MFINYGVNTAGLQRITVQCMKRASVLLFLAVLTLPTILMSENQMQDYVIFSMVIIDQHFTYPVTAQAVRTLFVLSGASAPSRPALVLYGVAPAQRRL